MQTIRIRKIQNGVFLLEALIGIVIFMVGALAMIALQANGIAAQTDAQSRIEAANLADQIIGRISISANRSTSATLQATLEPFEHNPGVVGNCSFNGGASANAAVTAWNNDVTAKLPGSTPAMRQILVDTANFNRVTVTICWQTASDAAPRRHSVIAFVN